MGLVVGTAAAIGATAFAAADIAAVGLTIGTALEAVAAIGAVTSVIGMATGNKNLQMAGMALGIVGGVGALAGSAGLFDSGESIFGSTASDAGAAGNATGGIGETVAAPPAVTTENLPAVDATGSVNPDLANPASGLINSATPDTAAMVTGGDAANPLTQQLTATPISDLSSTQTPGLTSADASAAAGTAPISGMNDAGTITANSSGAGPIGGMPAAMNPNTANLPGQLNSMTDLSNLEPVINQAPPGMLDSLMAFGKGNPMLAYGVVQAGGSLISGLTNPVTPAQIAALNAQANANNAATALAANQAKNNAQPLPTATVASAPVTGKPLLTNPAPGNGLINSQPASTVTGVPA